MPLLGHQQLPPSQGAHGCVNEEIPADPSPDVGIFLAILCFTTDCPVAPAYNTVTRGQSHVKPTPTSDLLLESRWLSKNRCIKRAAGGQEGCRDTHNRWLPGGAQPGTGLGE